MSMLGVLAVVLLAVLVLIAAARGIGVFYALWIGFSNSPYPWWVQAFAIAILVLGAAYLWREQRIRDRRRQR